MPPGNTMRLATTRPPGARGLAPCLTWRQSAANHHGTSRFGLRLSSCCGTANDPGRSATRGDGDLTSRRAVVLNTDGPRRLNRRGPSGPRLRRIYSASGTGCTARQIGEIAMHKRSIGKSGSKCKGACSSPCHAASPMCALQHSAVTRRTTSQHRGQPVCDARPRAPLRTAAQIL